jgi:hypothetical protein
LYVFSLCGSNAFTFNDPVTMFLSFWVLLQGTFCACFCFSSNICLRFLALCLLIFGPSYFGPVVTASSAVFQNWRAEFCDWTVPDDAFSKAVLMLPNLLFQMFPGLLSGFDQREFFVWTTFDGVSSLCLLMKAKNFLSLSVFGSNTGTVCFPPGFPTLIGPLNAK